MKIILVRHGQIDGNVHEYHVGQYDEPLNAKGLEQAKKAGERLKDEKIDMIYVSDLSRTMQTAKEIEKYHPDVPVVYDPLLREKNEGVFVKTPYGSIRKAAAEAGVPYREFKPEGGESIADFKARVGLLHEKLKSMKDKQTILIVTHGGIIINLLMHLFSIPEEDIKTFSPPNTAVTILELDFSTKHRIHTLNCIKHLL